MLFLSNLVELVLDAAPWLLFGMVVAGLVKAWAPQKGMARLLGGRGLGSVVNGALIGAPLPICSCGVLPAAIGLRRSGASREATTSFLVATPETGVDSVALSFGMLGPFLAIARPIAAISSAIATGLMMRFLPGDEAAPAEPAADTCATSGCCSSCGESEQAEVEAFDVKTASAFQRTASGLRYALVDIFDDIAGWMMIGLVLAAATMTWIPPQALSSFGGGLPAMLLMVLIGIPMYICATASTPVAASLLMVGVSPGAAMVFMLAGPATNIATLGVVRKEMGNRAVMLYLGGVIASALVAGLVTDFVARAMSIDIAIEMARDGEIVPEWLAVASAVILIAMAMRPLLLRLKKYSARIRSHAAEKTESVSS
jgi:hypothetical protein